jgi:hypothetical protein
MARGGARKAAARTRPSVHGLAVRWSPCRCCEGHALPPTADRAQGAPTASTAQAEDDGAGPVEDDEEPCEPEPADDEELEDVDALLDALGAEARALVPRQDDASDDAPEDEVDVTEDDGLCEDEDEPVEEEDDDDQGYVDADGIDDTLEELLLDSELDAGFLQVGGPGSVHVDAVLQPRRAPRAVVAVRRKTAPVALGARTIPVRRAGRVKVGLRLTKAGRAALRTQRQAFRVEVRETVRVKGKRVRTRARTLTVKVPKAKTKTGARPAAAG